MKPPRAEPSPARLEQAAEVFAEALERPPAERAAFLDAVCAATPALRAEVASLLAAYARSEGFLRRPHPAAITDLLDDPGERSLEGVLVGAYRIVRELGHGGMGTVYLAERADGQFEQRVALKLVRAGMASPTLLRRFLTERRILARLQHPNIARLLDGGVTDDERPFLAMEYVEGVPLTEYADARRLGIEARLQLVVDACGGVQHAHRNLVVHRDLKPANILVTAEGRVKLLDFGIAKLLDPDTEGEPGTLTEVGVRPMTPEYAAPEQVRGEPVTTATDVYALGAVLYELLSGHRPHRFRTRTLEEVARVLSEEEPDPPSAAVANVAQRRQADTALTSTPAAVALARGTTPERLRARLRGDLDAIALVALRAEPERRYPSAEALGEDIRRHLAGLPVSACKDTAWYRVGRFVRRNRTAVAAGVLALASLLAGLGATAWQARMAARQRDLALREADKAARVSSFMTDLFFFADPGQARGEDVTVREALDSGRIWIERELPQQPELRLEMAFQLGEVYYRLGLYREAEELWGSALAMGVAAHGEVHASVLRVMLGLIKVLEDLGLSDSAEVLARRALAIQRQLPELRSDDFAATHVLARLGNALRLQGRLEEADSVLREALAILPPDHPDAPHRRTVLLTTRAHVRRAAGDPERAEALLREILETRRAVWGEEHPEVAQVLVNLAGAIADQGRYPEAETVARQGLDMRRRLLGEDHPDVAAAVAGLADVLRLEGDAAAAAELYRQALDLYSETLPAEQQRRATMLFGLGLALLDQEQPAEAERALREALELRRGALGEGHPRVAEIRTALEAARERRP